MPYRIDLAGGWLDQPFVSRFHPGAVITLSIEPTVEFNERSGMATSTRRTALELWETQLPVDHLERTAKILFCCDNPPGTREISGSQDAIGIVYPGLAKAHYDGGYWPVSIEHHTHEETLRFVESSLYLAPLEPRPPEFDVLSDVAIDANGASSLAQAADACWQALLAHDAAAFGQAMTASFEAQIAMFPHMVTPLVLEQIGAYRDRALGWKVSGAGGGGYLILAADRPIPETIRCAARRAME
jgi:galactokinase/mevalonate kinase-like predicted kinase